MYNSIEDILSYVGENDVKFIRLAFCDIFGVQKNIAIQSCRAPLKREFLSTLRRSAVL